jgi:hypothetical protein
LGKAEAAGNTLDVDMNQQVATFSLMSLSPMSLSLMFLSLMSLSLMSLSPILLSLRHARMAR